VADASTMTHEMGHWIDDMAPGALGASLEFLEHRLGNEPYRPMSDVAEEAGQKDHSFRPE